MLVLIKGAGDIATGVAIRLLNARMRVVMTDIERPSAIRRTAAFSEAIYHGEATIEGHAACRAGNAKEALALCEAGITPVIADPKCACLHDIAPDVLADCVIAKRNTGTTLCDAGIVIGIGPGFTVGTDCHAAVETMRGHDLGRVFYNAGETPLANTGVPGLIAGYGAERVMHAPAAGIFHEIRHIGDRVEAGETVAMVGGATVKAEIPGVLRGLLPEGFDTPLGMKCADVDPRCKVEHCYTVTDKARAVGGGVLEAILRLQDQTT